MSYKLTFLETAAKEWKKLAPTIKTQFKKKIEERLKQPRIEADALHGLNDCYKIKLRSLGYRLVYRVYDERVVIQIIAVGKREKLQVYKKAAKRHAKNTD